MDIKKHDTDEQSLEIHFIDLIHQIIVNRWLILFIFLVSFCIGGVIIYYSKPIYETKLLLQIDGAPKNPIQEMLSQFNHHGEIKDPVATQMALIRSRYILEPVVENLGLNIEIKEKKSLFFSNFLHKNKVDVQLKKFDIPQKDLNKLFILNVKKNNHIELFNNNGTLLLSGEKNTLSQSKNRLYQVLVHLTHVKTDSQFMIKKIDKNQVVETLSKQIEIYELGDKQHSSTGVIELILKGHDKQKNKLILNEIARIAETKDIKKKSLEAAKTLDFLYKQLPTTQVQLENAENKLNAYRAQTGKLEIRIQTKYLLEKMLKLDEHIEHLKIKYQKYLTNYTKIHPASLDLNNEIKLLQQQREKLNHTIKSLPSTDQITINLLRNVQIKKMFYMILLRKIQALEITKAGTLSTINVLTFASNPLHPLPNQTRLTLILILLSASILSFILIMLRNNVLGKIEDPYWIEKHYQIPNLSIIPYAKEQKRLNSEVNKLLLLAYQYPKHYTIEALRSLRTIIQIHAISSSNNIISIMGGTPGIGKTFISINLAYLISTARKKVLLIDADLRKGCVHKYLNAKISPGLSDILEQNLTMIDAIQKNVSNNLDIISRGIHRENPSELLMNSNFKELLQQLSQNYDFIIIDTAPILMVTDGAIVGSITTNNYLVVGSGIHRSSELDLIIQHTKATGIHLSGTIFNISKEQPAQNLLGQYNAYGKYYNHCYKNYYEDN